MLHLVLIVISWGAAKGRPFGESRGGKDPGVGEKGSSVGVSNLQDYLNLKSGLYSFTLETF